MLMTRRLRPIPTLVCGALAVLPLAAGCQRQAEPPPTPAAAAIVVPEKPPEADWPSIRKKRIETFLLPAMQTTGIDMWLVMARGDYNDPLATFVGGEHAIGTAVYLFSIDGARLTRTAIVPLGDSTPVRESGSSTRC